MYWLKSSTQNISDSRIERRKKTSYQLMVEETEHCTWMGMERKNGMYRIEWKPAIEKMRRVKCDQQKKSSQKHTERGHSKMRNSKKEKNVLLQRAMSNNSHFQSFSALLLNNFAADCICLVRWCIDFVYMRCAYTSCHRGRYLVRADLFDVFYAACTPFPSSPCARHAKETQMNSRNSH